MFLSWSNDKQHSSYIAQLSASPLWNGGVELEHAPTSVLHLRPQSTPSATPVLLVRRTPTRFRRALIRKGLWHLAGAILSIHTLALSSILLSCVPCSNAAPLELLQNGSFKNGLAGWTVQGIAFYDGETIKITREGSLSQTVRRPDLSFYLELSYSLRTELPSQVHFARSLVTFYVVDRNGKANNFTVVGERHGELGDSGWKETRLSLLQLFRKEIGDLTDFQLSAIKIAIELGFTAPVPPPAAASIRNVSLRRVNPVRILLNENLRRQLADRTELVVSATNVGDIDASNLVATLVLPPQVVLISENTVIVRSMLEGGASWQLNWMLAAKSSGTHPITVKVSSDHGGTELSLSVPIPGMPQVTTTQTTKVTVERTGEQADQVIVGFLVTAFLVFLAFLILAIGLPILQRRRGTEVVYRLRPVRR